MKDFDARRQERAQADRSFRIGGKVFSYRPSVAPEAIMRWTAFTTATEREETALAAAKAQLAAVEAKALVPAEKDRLADPQANADHLVEVAALCEKAATAAAALHEAQESSDVVRLLDETITAIVEPDQEAQWQEVRSAAAAEPVSMQDLQELLEWLMEQVVARPTGQPSVSSTPPERRGTSLTDASLSQEVPAGQAA